MHSPPLRYRVLIALLSPVITALTLWQAWQARDKRFALQRLGFAYSNPQQSPVWIHCASVGEVRAALPLIDRMRADPRFKPVLVSTVTPTGAATVLQQAWQDVEHIYLPVDCKTAVARAFKQLKPRSLVLMETEIWPHLINLAQLHGIPVSIINGRLSERTLRTPDYLLPIYRQALSKVTLVLAKSAEDKRRFEQLGAISQRVRTTGNLKFAALATVANKPPNVLPRPFWLAASTHQDEELQLCRALLRARQSQPCLLVIAPRHPKRSAKIQSQLAELQLNFAVRSAGHKVDQNTQIYLADTLGEMHLWLHHAQVVFMGGSLVEIGGHNVLEPAAAAAAMVCGPHLHNFQEELELLSPSGALRQVGSADEVIDYVYALLADPDRRQQLGAAGYQAVQKSADILEQYIEALLPVVATQQ